jgi:UDP-2-acetamido-3-amino-2,3-dideoxy-glucuronate N-acetyltransferase
VPELIPSPKQKTTPRIAVVGGGYWGTNLIRNFHSLGALETICDVEPDRLAGYAQQYPDVQMESDYRNVLANPDIQGVVLATPARTHHDLAMMAMTAGKDVFVEKPLALKYSDGLAMASLAREKGCVLLVGHILEYHPAIIKLYDLINSGELGDIHYIYSNRLNLGKIRSEENILWSFAPHDISVITSIAGGEPESVSANAGTFIQSNVADITVNNLTFCSGMKAHIFVSWYHPYKEQKMVVIGSKKMAQIDGVAAVQSIQVYDKRVTVDSNGPTLHNLEGEMIPVDTSEPMATECQHFLDCISTRSQPITGFENGLRVLRVLEASQMSMDDNGGRVYLKDVR